jgi:hypothetical protein
MEQQTSKSQPIKSVMLKAGRKTYFFDVKISAKNRKYLKITESAFEGEDKPRKYTTFFLDPELVPSFQESLNETIGHLS